MATAVQPDKILKELGKLWVDLSKSDENGVLRACAMTLIAVVDEKCDAQSVTEIIARLMHEHPSRVIVIRVTEAQEPHLESRVFAQCWMPFGRRQQICCEGVEITSSQGSLADVVPVVRALVAPDLPVVLYSPSESLWWTPGFQLLLPLAGKLIVNSREMPDPTRVLLYLSSLPRELLKADLAWSQLTPWRESVAQIFEDPALARSVYDLSEVDIRWSDKEEPPALYYLYGWFMHVLGGSVKVNFARADGPAFASIVRIALSGPGFEASVELKDSSSAEVVVNGRPRQITVFPEIGDCEALRQELALAGRDVIFEDVLGLANLMKGNP